MDSLLYYTRYLHILAGFIGFFVAPVALTVRKGGVAHRRWGQVFFWAMLVAGSTAIIMASIKGLTFLLLTGIFSLYLAQFGYRSLYHRQLAQGKARPSLYDWLSVLAGMGIFAGTLGYGLLHRPFNVVMLVFGVIGLFTTLRQLSGFMRPGAWPPGQWLSNHISGFMGAYIASVSAFSATSLKFISFPLNFLWPLLVLVPLRIWFQRRYVPATGISPRVVTS
jgi:hypothetical protein